MTEPLDTSFAEALTSRDEGLREALREIQNRLRRDISRILAVGIGGILASESDYTGWFLNHVADDDAEKEVDDLIAHLPEALAITAAVPAITALIGLVEHQIDPRIVSAWKGLTGNLN